MPSVDDQLFEAAREGHADVLAALLDGHPDKLGVRAPPYEWTLLHTAANGGHMAAVDLLLARGIDVNARESGDNTVALHWAAAQGHLDIVRRLADAGSDVIGRGDDHALEVIGWASCWDNARPEVVELLVSRGARHHIFSAIAMNLAGEVGRIASADPSAVNSRMSRNESHRTALQHAVRMNRPEMVTLLLELGADPLAVDDSGQPVAAYATAPDTDLSVMRVVRGMTAAELQSAVRGHRPPRIGLLDLAAALALGEWDTAERLARESPGLIDSGGAASGALHLMAKRNDTAAVRWLLDHGADPNSRWAHWDSIVTPLHLAVLGGHAAIVGQLLDAGADPTVHDSKHDSDAVGWAEFFGQTEIVRRLKGVATDSPDPG